MAYATVTLSGTYQTPDGTPHKGHVEIIPSERVIKDTTGDVILTGRVKVDLDAQGAFTVELPATDDPTLNPTGFGYTIAAKLHSSHPPAVSFSLPAALGATTVEDVTPVDPATFAPTTTYAEKSELDAVAATIPTTAADVNALPDTTVIPSTAADVGAEPAGLAQATQDTLAATYARATSVASRSRAGGRKIAWCGDSITNGSSATNTYTTSYRAMVQKIAGGRYISEDAINAGVPGDASAQLLARMDTIIASGAQALFVMIGTNDAGQGITLADYKTNVQGIKAKADAAGLPIGFGLVPPREATASAAVHDAVRSYNLWLRLWAATAGIPVADTFTPLANASGHLAATYDAGDGPHPNDAGHLALAQAISPTVQSLIVPSPWPIVAPGLGLLPDPLMSSLSTPGTWVLQGGASVARSLVPATNGDLPAGQWMRFTLNNSGGGSTVLGTMGLTIPSSGYSPGDLLAVALYMRASTATALNKVQVMDGGLVQLGSFYESGPSANPGPMLRGYTVPASPPATIKLGVVVRADAGQTTTVDIGAADVLNLTRRGVVDVF